MICSRCGDRLVEDRFMDWAARWRCLKCGHVQDSLSAQGNPTRQEQGIAVETTEPEYFDEEVHLGSESFVGLNVTYRYHPAAVQTNRDNQKVRSEKSKNARRAVQEPNPIT